MIHVHRLDGCAPTPLAHYLKALGVLRLVSEQADRDARAWWDGDRFRLATSLRQDQLSEFFLTHYSPTPMLAPWNGASGFFKTWDKKNKRFRGSRNFDTLEKVRQSTDPRWRPFRAALADAAKVVEDVTSPTDVAELTDKKRERFLLVPSNKGSVAQAAHKDRDKSRIQAMMQRALSREPFYRSAIIDVGDKCAYPSIWGSGGNDGAMDFSARYMQNLLLVMDTDRHRSGELLECALLGSNVKHLLKGSAGKVGQFLPGGAGGANSVQGYGDQNDTLLNPWDFVLMLEGAVCLTSHVSRQSGSNSLAAAAPFAVRAHGAAYSSASAEDKSRGEQWMPLWSRPSTHTELRHLLAEGRAQLGARSVREPLDFACALQRMGTARGVKAFQRYGYIERNGQANLAVPLGRFLVADRPSAQLACLDDLDRWMRGLRREARKPNGPKHLADALFAVSAQPDDKGRWQDVLLRLAEVEQTMANGSGFAAGPVPRLRPEWATACDDGTAEFRLALAFALQARDFRGVDRTPVDPIRRHWLPLEEAHDRFATTGTGSATRLRKSTGVVARGQRGVDDAIALVERRLVEGAQQGERHLPLKAAPGATVGLVDIAQLVAGNVDLDRTVALSQALMAVNRAAWADRHFRVGTPAKEEMDWPDDAWLAIRLCALPWRLPMPKGFELDVGTDPTLVRLLATGDAGAAFELAARRLGAAGVRCTVRVAATSHDTARLWAAALAFPISQSTARRLLRRLDPNKE